jgi:hypothetical protein
MEPTKDEYDAAKSRQLADPAGFSSREPTDEVLADVAVINDYERAQDALLRDAT